MMAETTNTLAVRLVTPDRVLVDATAEAVELPSQSGYLEALYGHAPLLAELAAGEVRLHGGTSGEQKFFVAWGVCRGAAGAGDDPGGDSDEARGD